MSTAVRFFSLDHPAAQGHFPGNPIIPGAVLLSETLRAIEAGVDLSQWPSQTMSAKFLYPARPGDHVRIEYSVTGAGAVKFACSVDKKTVLTGLLKKEALSSPA